MNACRSVTPGVYKSICKVYHVPALILILNEDKTFEYKRPYVNEEISGTWEVNKKNELILKSKKFIKKKSIYEPDYKFTKHKGSDVYKIKRNKLLIYDTLNKYTRKCYLIKISDSTKPFKSFKFFNN